MADKKISQLTAATTPLAGTEVLPIVQSGVTKKVTALELTGTTVDSSGNVTVPNGNFVPSTAAKGVNFTANTPAAGMTSQLLNWYEEGNWTPTANGITYAAGTAGKYTRVGNLVTCTFLVVFPTTANGSNAQIKELPFVSVSSSAATFGNYSIGFNGPLNNGNSFIGLVNTTGTAFIANSTLSGQTLVGSITYQV